MSSLETLRRQYAKLTPFERAAMQLEAIERRDEAALDALTPPSLWDVAQVLGDKLTFAVLAFAAVYESQRGETLNWLSMSMFGIMHRELVKGEIEESPEQCEKLDAWINHHHEGLRRARAWLVALEALDKETGGACMTYARIFAGEHVNCIMSRAADEEIDYSAELEHLREL